MAFQQMRPVIGLCLKIILFLFYVLCTSTSYENKTQIVAVDQVMHFVYVLSLLLFLLSETGQSV